MADTAPTAAATSPAPVPKSLASPESRSSPPPATDFVQTATPVAMIDAASEQPQVDAASPGASIVIDDGVTVSLIF